MPGLVSAFGHAIGHVRPGLAATATTRYGLRTITLRSAAV